MGKQEEKNKNNQIIIYNTEDGQIKKIVKEQERAYPKGCLFSEKFVILHKMKKEKEIVKNLQKYNPEKIILFRSYTIGKLKLQKQ